MCALLLTVRLLFRTEYSCKEGHLGKESKYCKEWKDVNFFTDITDLKKLITAVEILLCVLVISIL